MSSFNYDLRVLQRLTEIYGQQLTRESTNFTTAITLNRKTQDWMTRYTNKRMRETMMPSPQVIASYEKYVARCWEQAYYINLVAEGGERMYGYASGELAKSIEVSVGMGEMYKPYADSSWMIRGYESKFDLKYHKYGDAISEGRVPNPIPIEMLVKWIEDKQRRGATFDLTNDGKDNHKSYYEQVVSFAFRINKKGVVSGDRPDWNMTDPPTDKVDKWFRTIYNRSKSYHVKRISESIKQNIIKNKKA